MLLIISETTDKWIKVDGVKFFHTIANMCAFDQGVHCATAEYAFYAK